MARPRKYPPWTAKRLAEFRLCWDLGWPTRRIGRFFDVPVSVICVEARRRKFPLRFSAIVVKNSLYRRHPYGISLSDALDIVQKADSLRAMLAEGRTTDELCRALHVPRQRLQFFMAVLNLTFPTPQMPAPARLRKCAACRSTFTPPSRYVFRCADCADLHQSALAEYLGVPRHP